MVYGREQGLIHQDCLSPFVELHYRNVQSLGDANPLSCSAATICIRESNHQMAGWMTPKFRRGVLLRRFGQLVSAGWYFVNRLDTIQVSLSKAINNVERAPSGMISRL